MEFRVNSEEPRNCIAVEFSWNGRATNGQEPKRQIRLFDAYFLMRFFAVILRSFDSVFPQPLQKLLIFRQLFLHEL